MPWLEFCTLKWYIESYLDDFVIRAQYPLCHGIDPRISHDVDKADNSLRVYLHIPTAGSPADGTTWSLDRFPKSGHVVFI